MNQIITFPMQKSPYWYAWVEKPNIIFDMIIQLGKGKAKANQNKTKVLF